MRETEESPLQRLRALTMVCLKPCRHCEQIDASIEAALTAERNRAERAERERDTLRQHNAVLRAECQAGGWIVGDGAGRWRTWDADGPGWSVNRDEAVRYARREDAERQHAEDDDAWTVTPYSAATDAAGAMGEVQDGDGN